MIARPLRRLGPIPFAPFPPLAERPLERAMLNGHRETRDVRETRIRSRWLPSSPAIQAVKAPSASAPQASSSIEPRQVRGGCHAVYHGQGTLSVLSSITGHHYRFEGRGCTLTIDPRDRLVLGRLNELTIHTASN